MINIQKAAIIGCGFVGAATAFRADADRAFF